MLILPLGTHREDKSTLPVLTLLVCAACILVHLLVRDDATKLAYAYDPGTMHVGHMVTSTFLHGDILHLLGNLFFFYCFSSTIEKEITVKGYVAIFAVFTVITNVAYALLTTKGLPTLGLSGVVWGFMGLFLARFPLQKIDCFFWFLWIVRTVAVPALVFVLGFLAMDIGALRRNDPGVNHVAHLSGFMGGLLLIGFWSLLEREAAPRRPGARPRGGRVTPPAESRRGHDWK